MNINNEEFFWEELITSIIENIENTLKLFLIKCKSLVKKFKKFLFY